MIYQILSWILKIACRVYFRKIEIHGSVIPPNRPLLLLANHQSALMDAIVLAAFCQRPLYFLARGESFNKQWKRWLWKQFNMIPIYRPVHSPSMVRHNPNIFKYCHQLFDDRQALVIFPEGISKTDRQLRPIKTGAARIILGFEPNTEELALIPVGLNYNDPHRFRAELIINIGAEISIKPYRQTYAQNQSLAIKQLSEQMARALKKLIIVVDKPETEKLTRQLEQHYKEHLLQQAAVLERPGSRSFHLSKDIVRAIHYFEQHRQRKASELRKRICLYTKNLKDLGLERLSLSVPRLKEHALPIWVDGLDRLCYIACYPVGWLSRTATHFFCQRPDFKGTLLLLFGTLSALLYTISWLLSAYWLTHSVGLCVLLSLLFVLMAVRSLRYIDRRAFQKEKYLLTSLRPDIVRGLVVEREFLLSELGQLKEIFLNERA